MIWVKSEKIDKRQTKKRNEHLVVEQIKVLRGQ
jgi:hypothetical protein